MKTGTSVEQVNGALVSSIQRKFDAPVSCLYSYLMNETPEFLHLCTLMSGVTDLSKKKYFEDKVICFTFKVLFPAKVVLIYENVWD